MYTYVGSANDKSAQKISVKLFDNSSGSPRNERVCADRERCYPFSFPCRLFPEMHSQFIISSILFAWMGVGREGVFYRYEYAVVEGTGYDLVLFKGFQLLRERLGDAYYPLCSSPDR